MRSDNGYGSRASLARGVVALFAIMLAMGLGTLVSPAAAAPFAYVTNEDLAGTVSVIDTATNMVVATIPVGEYPFGIAVTPDGKHAYVANNLSGNVSVIDTTTNTVVATVPVGTPFLTGVAVTPDGKHVYIAKALAPGTPGTVSVIDTATNTVEAATIGVGSDPGAVAITPDGKHVYVTQDNSVSVIDTASNTVVATVTVNFADAVAITPDGKHAYVTEGSGPQNPGTVSVIDTATNTVEAVTIPVGTNPSGVAVTPDGTHVYVTNPQSYTVSVIATATNTVVTTVGVGVGYFPQGVAVAPDGKHAYVANNNNTTTGTVSVIDTATNTVVATVPVGFGPFAVAIMPPPVGVPFLAFNAKLEIDLDRKPNQDRFELQSHFTLSSTAPAIHPHRDPVTLQIGTFSIMIPPGSFKKHEGENEGAVFSFHGVIDGVRLEALIKQTGTLRYAFDAEAKGADLTGTKNPVTVMLTIGGDSGTASVTADIDH